MNAKMLTIIGLLAAALLLLFFMGPRAEVDTMIIPSTLPEDLDRYLEGSEAALEDITPGARKCIVWADQMRRSRTDISIVYLHGFSATRQETAPLCDTVAARLKANLFYTRLAGHGRPGEALAGVTVNDWLHDADQAIAIGKRLGRKVVIVATSTGATLATWLAAHRKDPEIAGYVLISPNYGLVDRTSEILLWPWARYFAPLIVGRTREWKPLNEAHGRYWTTRYPTAALVAMMGLVELVRETPVEQIEAPVLMIFSPKDSVVDAAEIEAVYGRISSKTRRKLVIQTSDDPNHHVLAGDILAPGQTDYLAGALETFIRSLAGE